MVIKKKVQALQQCLPHELPQKYLEALLTYSKLVIHFAFGLPPLAKLCCCVAALVDLAKAFGSADREISLERQRDIRLSERRARPSSYCRQ